jgi:hypothetical protein
MADREIEAVLERLNKSRVTCKDGVTLEVWRDFEAEETRIRIPREPMLRLDEDRLCDFLNDQGGPITEERIIELLCDIYRRPLVYAETLVKS